MTSRDPEGFTGDDSADPAPAHASGASAARSERRSKGRSRADSAQESQVSDTPQDAGSRDWTRRDAEPYEPGNTASLTHGANSERAIALAAVRVHGELLAVAPYLAEAKFLPAVNRYLRAAAREALLDDHIARLSESKGAGAVAPRVWEQVTAASRLAARLASDLGLDPVGHARIRALTSGAEATEAALSGLAARGRAIRAGRAGAELAATDDEDDEA